jgi:hypothetical protein
VPKYKGKRVAGEPGTIEYRGYKIYNNKGEEGAPYLIYGPGESNPDDGAETLRDSKFLIDGFLGKKMGGTKVGKKSIMDLPTNVPRLQGRI